MDKICIFVKISKTDLENNGYPFRWLSDSDSLLSHVKLILKIFTEDYECK